METKLPIWKPAHLLGAEETETVSQYTGGAYRIQTAAIGTPPSDGYPVLYIPDGDAFFPSLLSIAQSLMINPMMNRHAPCLIVGIGYPGETVRNQTRRSEDYTPPMQHEQKSGYGGAERFGQFIDRELKPMLAAKFPINHKEQAIFGHSFGGLFGLYSLLAAKRFNRFLLVSPSVWWDKRSVLTLLPNLKDGTGISVRISAGEYEQTNDGNIKRNERAMLDNAQETAKLLSEAGCKASFRLYLRATHGSVPFYAMTDEILYLAEQWHQK